MRILIAVGIAILVVVIVGASSSLSFLKSSEPLTLRLLAVPIVVRK